MARRPITRGMLFKERAFIKRMIAHEELRAPCETLAGMSERKQAEMHRLYDRAAETDPPMTARQREEFARDVAEVMTEIQDQPRDMGHTKASNGNRSATKRRPSYAITRRPEGRNS